jgi:hypothetical protein
VIPTRAAVAGLALLAAACAHRPPPMPAEAGYPGTLADLGSVPGDFVWRQAIAARYGDQSGSFEAVVQKQGGRLLILGLTPMGTRAFLLEQEGQAVKATVYVDRAMPFPPKYVVLDVHRTYFLGIAPHPHDDGWHQVVRDGETIRELWRGGRLFERRFERLDHHPPGQIVIRYDGGYAPAPVPHPGRIVFDNGWFGYQLTIDTLEAEPLDGRGAPR